MVVRTKYEDTVYERVEYSGKIFMYSSVSWQVLFPIVDIIRLLKKNTIICHVYGKGQQIIKTYSPQYYHCLLGYELKNKINYLENLKTVKNIFIFSDESDIIATNLINTAKKNKINVICYSNLDTTYHFYNNTDNTKFSFKKPEEVIEKMYFLLDFESANKYAELFDDFEIIEPGNANKESSLDDCIEKLKQIDINVKKEKDKKIPKLFDPHLNRIKQMEYERSTKNIIYPDSVEHLAHKEVIKHKSLLSKFFKNPKL